MANEGDQGTRHIHIPKILETRRARSFWGSLAPALINGGILPTALEKPVPAICAYFCLSPTEASVNLARPARSHEAPWALKTEAVSKGDWGMGEGVCAHREHMHSASLDIAALADIPPLPPDSVNHPMIPWDSNQECPWAGLESLTLPLQNLVGLA